MQPEKWTIASTKTHFSHLKRQILEHIPLKNSVLTEAHAQGLGFRTQAALAAAFKATPDLPPRKFDKAAFIEGVAALADEATAEAISEILDGVSLDITVIKLSDQRQNAGRYADIVYDVQVRVRGLSAARLDEEVLFHLPEFGLGPSLEPYRVDSAHDCRAITDYRKTRFGAGEATVVAKLVNGEWHGGFYVYAADHQADDAHCIKSLKAALARAILPRLPTRVRCSIFRPDGYQVGAWRVEARLSPGIQRFWSGSPLQFEIPQWATRIFQMTREFKFGPYEGIFVDGVWKADLYSNGIKEAENPIGLTEVRRALIQCVESLALQGGFREEGELQPVFNDAKQMIGTAQLRNGQHEAWTRVRRMDKRDNSHTYLGRFNTFDDAVAAIRTTVESPPSQGL